MEDIPLDSLVPTKSEYLNKEDVGLQGKNVTIAGFKMAEVGQGQEAEMRCIMDFQEDIKPMVVNKTNMQRLKHITGAETTGQALGKQINIFNDPMVEFGGNLVGGIRIRPVQGSPAMAQPGRILMGTTGQDFNDDVPF